MFKRCGMSTEKQANGVRPREVTRFCMDSRRYTVGLNQGGTPLTKDTTKVCTPRSGEPQRDGVHTSTYGKLI